MASDSEPRNFFSRPPQGPLRSHILGSKKPVRLLMSRPNYSAQLEFKLTNSNSGSCRTTYRAQYSSSFLAAVLSRRFSSAVC